MQRIRLDTQLEESQTSYNVLVTDVDGKVKFLPPGTSGKFLVSTASGLDWVFGNSIPTKKEVFSNLISGNTIELLSIPSGLVDLDVFRNGIMILNYSLSGKVITFNEVFTASGGATGAEEVIVKYK